MSENKQFAVYVCTNRHCQKKGLEVKAMIPSAIRQTIGRALTCIACGEVMFRRRMGNDSEAADFLAIRS